MRKKFFVNKVNREKRLEFAKTYQNKDREFWNKVIFSDESKFNIFGSDGRRTVWRKKKLRTPAKSFSTDVSAEKLGLGGDFVFQQDNDPKHTAYNTKNWLLYNVPGQLHTPPQSPDMNPIEHLWRILENSIRGRQASNLAEFIDILQKAWEEISPAMTKNLVDSMPRRLQAVIDAKGFPTKY
ncbi:unnamed protein product [Euphydryas editha]|uniref:Tc1-like transposase DDE domain-containing protein n=1 Tax=Euphydryas editha TaxID=104508 RepID=A0AAU9VD65_EUPED|nr:unnamed protein product [Euphydryas editha]